MGDSNYSFSLTTFNPSGKLLQIEYALKAVSMGNTTIGIRTKNGVVLAAERALSSPLIEENTIQRIVNLTDNIGVVYSGLGPDFRILTKKARKRAIVYETQFHTPIPVLMLVREIAAVMQEYTQSGGVRPFGVSLLVAGFDHLGPQLFQVDPSGAYFGWKASSLGSNATNAKEFLEKRYQDEMELEDGIHTALLTLKEGFDGEMNDSNIQVGIIDSSQKFRLLSRGEIKDYIEETE